MIKPAHRPGCQRRSPANRESARTGDVRPSPCRRGSPGPIMVLSPRSPEPAPEGPSLAHRRSLRDRSPRAVATPELLAPAGDRTCLIAAIENGADAVYFGLQGPQRPGPGRQLRPGRLPEVMALLHRRGVKGYVTLNTLAFPRELDDLEPRPARRRGRGRRRDRPGCRPRPADPRRHARPRDPRLDPDVGHRGEGVRLARELGCSRVILARELSLREIARIRQEAELPSRSSSTGPSASPIPANA